ncbi:uncharacterized protein PHALS_01903 [Plasmopara halstedii]|uniref:RxLR-like protein n=1 Tax=Plasmopara halstedii TaxID=4781 RepID=A0A0P1AWH7_PLAHL|nr:uncharacterized protein PHALS_01903 [Plasmopara halstedii]CEG45618.1 hypothetical protein PHALS_01903 [Plasmopara halstedii]|eukprot:XP_024581987.1 hypothetical protein PHALS_01903 [Plasmopara halstedii]
MSKAAQFVSFHNLQRTPPISKPLMHLYHFFLATMVILVMSTEVFTEKTMQTSSNVNQLRTTEPAASDDAATSNEERHYTIAVPPNIVQSKAAKEFTTVTTYDNNGLLQRVVKWIDTWFINFMS